LQLSLLRLCSGVDISPVSA